MSPNTTRSPFAPGTEDYRAYIWGWRDGWNNKPRKHGAFPVQPYSKGYWDGRADKEEPKP